MRIPTMRHQGAALLVAALLSSLRATSLTVQAQEPARFHLVLRIQTIDATQTRTPLADGTITVQDDATGALLATATSDVQGQAQTIITAPPASAVRVVVQGTRPDGTPLFQDGADGGGYRLPLLDPATPIPVWFMVIPSGQVLPDPALWQGGARLTPSVTPNGPRGTLPPAPFLGDLWPDARPTRPTPAASPAAITAPVDPVNADLHVRVQNDSGRPLRQAHVVLRRAGGHDRQQVALTPSGEVHLAWPPDLAAVVAPPVFIVHVVGTLRDGTSLSLPGQDARGIRILPDPEHAGPQVLTLRIRADGKVMPIPQLATDESISVLMPDHLPTAGAMITTTTPAATSAPVSATPPPTRMVAPSSRVMALPPAITPIPETAAANARVVRVGVWGGLLAALLLGGVGAVVWVRARQPRTWHESP